MKLHSELVKLKSGNKIRIRYWDRGKNKILSKTEHPDFENIGEAKDWCKRQNDKAAIEKIVTRNRSLTEIAVKNDLFSDSQKLIDEFSEWQKTKNDDSGESWLLLYVFPFFRSRNVQFGLWPEFYDEFKDYLLHAVSDKTGRKLSYSSRNHAIKNLNRFLKFLKEKKKIITAFDKCSYFDKGLLVSRGYESVIKKNEQELLAATMEDDECLEPKSVHKTSNPILLTFLSPKIPNPFRSQACYGKNHHNYPPITKLFYLASQ
jgi:hypothetical protein